MDIQSLLNAYASIYLRINGDGKVSAFNGYTFIDIPDIVVDVKPKIADAEIPQMAEIPVEIPTVPESAAIGYETAQADVWAIVHEPLPEITPELIPEIIPEIVPDPV